MKKNNIKRMLASTLAVITAIMIISSTPLGTGDRNTITANATTSADLEVSENGIDFICSVEGFHSKCYSDYSQSSIGFGTKCTGSSAQPHASGSHSITREAAMAALREQLRDEYAPRVRKQTSGVAMNQNQFDALVSLCYNCGGGTTRISNSPLVKYLRGELSADEARSEYSNYIVTAGGSRLQGLVNRRNQEADLFFSGEIINDEELGIPYPRPTGSPLLKKGSKGREVGWLQYALHEKLGFDIGGAGIDCDLGSATQSAIRLYQSSRGLAADGIAGPDTIGAIVNELKPTPPPTPVVPSVPSLSISAGTDVSPTVLNWNACENTDFYGVRVYKADGTQVKYIEPYPSLSFSIQLPEGSYYASIASVNFNGNYKICNNVSFSVSATMKYANVSFDFNGANASADAKTVKQNSQYGELPAPTREGYTFDGWFTSKEGGTKVTADTVMTSASDHTLYAHWTGMKVNITLVDDLNGENNQFSARYGDKFNVVMMKKMYSPDTPDPTVGKLFIGWSDKPEGEVILESGDIIKPVSGQEIGSLVLYARWISPKLSLKVNGQESYEALPGETVNVTLEIEGAERAYGTFQTRFTFSPELQLMNGTAGKAFPVTIVENDSLVAFAGASSRNSGRDGVIYSCELVIPDNAPRGSVYPIELLFDDYFIFKNIKDETVNDEMQRYIEANSKNCIVKVKEFSIDETEITLQNGSQYEIAVNEDGVIYSSNDHRVAVVSKNGVITAVGEGTAKISVITPDSEVVQIDVTVTTCETAVVKATLYGDVNLDGKVTAADATAIMQYIANRDKYVLSEQSIVNADVSGDGDGITAKDALMIQQVDSGMISVSDLSGISR